MRTPLVPYRRSYFIVIAVAVICLAGASAWSLKPALRQESRLPMNNKTRNLEVINFEPRADSVRISLKNSYDKKITAYSISVVDPQSVFSFEEDFIVSDRVIAPGTVYAVSIPLPQSNSGSTASRQQQFNVLAVVFEDGTGDGDSQAISLITGNRLGRKALLRRILPLLKEFTTSRDIDELSAFDKLRANISSLQYLPEDGSSESIAHGFQKAKEEAILDLNNLKQEQHLHADTSLQDKLRTLEEDYVKLSAKL